MAAWSCRQALLALAEHEEVFLTVVAEQGGFDFVQRAAAAAVAQRGELGSVAFPGEDGGDDGLGADAIHVAEDVVDVEVHFGERLSA